MSISITKGEAKFYSCRTAIAFVTTFILPLLLIPRTEAFPKSTKPNNSKQLTVPQLVRQIMPSMVRLTVLGKDGVPSVQGSGFVVGEDIIATNAHVVSGAHAVTANFESGRSEQVFGYIGYDEDHDLVLLRAFTKGVRPLPLESGTEVQIGDSIVAFGSPEGLSGSISTGIVSGVRLMGGTKVIQTTAPISHGSSGGVLVDMRGHVAGVTSFFYTEGQNLNFAYPAYYVRQLLTHQLGQVLTWNEIEKYANTKTANVATIHAAPSIPSRAADTVVYTKTPLEGIKEVAVVLESLNEDAKKDGLDGDAIKTDAEVKLREAGISVVDKTSEDPSKPGALLYIIISTNLVSDDMLYRYSVELNVSEYATLTRAVPVKTIVTTWNCGSYGTVGKLKISTLRETVSDDVARFINDYLRQNPKSETGP